jgi:malonate decarboxylase delta subunit
MQELRFEFPVHRQSRGRAHVGVVASGDLEVLMEGSECAAAQVQIRTSVSQFDVVWEATLARFCARADVGVKIEINDFGATPGMVLLRLEQALEQLEKV